MEPQGWVTGSVRMRRSSPAWPSSWAFTTACCPGGCHRALSLPRVLSALQGRGPSKLPRPPCPREWASAQAPWKLPSLESGLGVEAWLLLRTWPGLGLTCEALGGTPWLWGWLTLPSPKGAGVTHVSHGAGGSGTAASKERWASPPGPVQLGSPHGSLGLLQVLATILAAIGVGRKDRMTRARRGWGWVGLGGGDLGLGVCGWAQ